MKKISLSLTMLAAVLLLITGCGAGNKTETAASSSNETIESSSITEESKTEDDVDLNSLEFPQLNPEVADNEDLVEMVTSMGTIKIKLFPEQAPKAVENFLTHAKDGYYDGGIFHRVIEDFMIQGGDPEGTGMGGETIWGDEFVPEISNQLYHLNGALAMARTGKPLNEPSQSSQFYIVQNAKDQSGTLADLETNPNADYKFPDKIKEEYKKGGVPFLDTQYSVFGQVIEGLDVVNKIGTTETAAGDKPVKDVTIEKINILKEAKK